MLRHLEDKEINHKFKGRLKVIDDFVYTICTKQMRIPNSGIIDIGGRKYRYLTERECFRFMGFSDEDIDVLIKTHPIREKYMSSILYKQSGNSIVVDVLEKTLDECLKFMVC